MATKIDDSGGLNAEINVTPMIDVMLVLLVIFMATAPMLTTGVDVDLPKTVAPQIQDDDEPLVLSISLKRELRLGGTKLQWTKLQATLAANDKVQKEDKLYIEADQGLDYGVVVAAMAAAKNAGVTNVMMLTDPTEGLRLEELDAPQ